MRTIETLRSDFVTSVFHEFKSPLASSEELLMQVWLNILGNAIKFTPKNSDISLTLEESADGMTVTISDTGIGMTEEVQKRIFDKFYQADHSGYTDGN